MKKPREDTSGVHLWLVLMKAYRALDRLATNSISGSGLCLTDVKILEILLHRGPMPVNTLAGRVELSSGSATAAVDRLAARRLVERRFRQEDRRQRVVHATEAGLTLARDTFRGHAAAMERAAGGLSEGERMRLLALLRRFGARAARDKENADVTENL